MYYILYIHRLMKSPAKQYQQNWNTVSIVVSSSTRLNFKYYTKLSDYNFSWNFGFQKKMQVSGAIFHHQIDI